MNLDEPEGQIEFLIYSVLRAVRHPRILKEINIAAVLRSELKMRKHKVGVCGFTSFLTGCNMSQASGALCELDLPLRLCRYKTRDCLFALIRILKPDIVVETGCGGGYSSAYILEAMRQNKKGILYSIDSKEHYDDEYYNLPRGLLVGGMVPPDLVNHNWHLLTNGAEGELPELLSKLGKIDIFIHDSLHTRENMLFEYRIAWEHLRGGGLLLSHDIWEPWLAFTREVKREYRVYQHYGGIIK